MRGLPEVSRTKAQKLRPGISPSLGLFFLPRAAGAYYTGTLSGRGLFEYRIRDRNARLGCSKTGIMFASCATCTIATSLLCTRRAYKCSVQRARVNAR